MINKKSYRLFLVKEMDQLTPTLAGYPIPEKAPEVLAAPHHRLHPLVFALGGAFSVIALVLALVLPNVIPVSPKPIGHDVANEEPNYFSSRIFNAVITKEENYTYTVPTEQPVEANRDSRYQIYQSFTVLDSFYIKTCFPDGMAPFFPDEFANQQIDTVVAWLKIEIPQLNYLGKRYYSNYYQSFIVFRYGTIVQGFLGYRENNQNSIDSAIGPSENYYFESREILTPNHLAIENQKGEQIYDIKIRLGESIHDVEIEGSVRPSPFDSSVCVIKQIPCNVDLTSWSKNDLSNVVALAQDAAPLRVDIKATVTGKEPSDRRTFYVESETAPALKTVFSQYYEINGEVYSAGDIDMKVGSEISFFYFRRFEGPTPDFLWLHVIEIL